VKSKIDDAVVNLIGPKLTEEFSEQIRLSVVAAAGFELSHHDLIKIQHAGITLYEEPATLESRNALEEFDKAASKLLATLNTIEFQAKRGILIGRTNLADCFVGEAMAENQEKIELLGSFWNPRDYILCVRRDLTLLREHARKTISTAKRVKRGGGREVVGYDKFVLACKEVWDRYRNDKGFSITLGRGSGPFVRFVYLVQNLIPPPKRKATEAAVGDAVVKILKGTKQN
jgi:hypothetical protein